MKMSIKYTLELDLNEASVLNIVLGSLTDHDFADIGIISIDRDIIRNIYYVLPNSEDKKD